MSGAVGLGLILFAMALLVAFHGQERIGGLAPGEFAAAASLVAIALLATGWMVNHFRGRWTSAVNALAAWIAIIIALVALYGFRFELQEIGNRVLAEIVPGRAVVTRAGEVVVHRRVGGNYVIAGQVNGRATRFIFDTGASTVVLTAESAGALGLDPARLDFRVPVSTANGTTTAAPVVLERISVGPITARRVRALVARPGVLAENLLGMTFLERLASYEVRNGRLILRGQSG